MKVTGRSGRQCCPRGHLIIECKKPVKVGGNPAEHSLSLGSPDFIARVRAKAGHDRVGGLLQAYNESLRGLAVESKNSAPIRCVEIMYRQDRVMEPRNRSEPLLPVKKKPRAVPGPRRSWAHCTLAASPTNPVGNL